MAGEDKLGEALFVLSAQAKNLFDTIDKGKVAADRLQSHFNQVSSAVTSALAAIGVGVSFGAILKETIAAEDAAMNLESAVRSTGMAAGFTASQLKLQATALQDMTRFADESIMNMQASLLRFSNITGPVFMRAQQAALDFAQATGQDAASAAKTLGMALNDPSQGMTRLSRAGVQLNLGLQEQIRTLADNGKIVQAQTMLLDEFSRAVGGRAKDAVNTLGGALDQLRNKFSDYFLEINGPIRDTFVTTIKLITDNMGTIWASMNAVFGGFKKIIEDVIEKLFNLGTGVSQLFQGEIRAALDSFYKEAEDIRSPFDVAIDTFNSAKAAVDRMGEAARNAMNDMGNAGAAAATASEAGLAAAKGAEEAFLRSQEAVKTAQTGMVAGAELTYTQLVQMTQDASNRAMLISQTARDQAMAGLTSQAEASKRLAESAARESEQFAAKAIAAQQRMSAAYAGLKNAAGNAIGGMLADFARGKIGLQQFVQQMMTEIAMLIAKMLILKALGFGFAGSVGMGFLGGMSGARAEGGPVQGGKTYLVGEEGPELFTADRSGSITPNDELGGGGSVTVNNNISVSAMEFGDGAVVARVLKAIAEKARQGTSEAIAAARSLSDANNLYTNRAVA